MNRFTLMRRGLRFHWRTHLATVMGAALSTAVLVGALAAGDSVRGSLRQLALQRLGAVEFAMTTGDRFFRSALADGMTTSLSSEVASVIQVPGAVTRTDDGRRANRIQVLGVDARFWAMAPDAAPPAQSADDEAVVNAALARKLGLSPGDDILVRVEKPSALSRDVPLSSDKNVSVALRLRVRNVAADSQFGRFSLRAEQAAPLNIYVPLTRLASELDQEGRANVLLAASRGTPASCSLDDAARSLRSAWTLADIGLEVRELPDRKAVELRSNRMFLEPAVLTAAFARELPTAEGGFTYFVNAIRAGERSTPYSFVSAAGNTWVPAGETNREIVVNEWLADDLGVKPGDPVELAYYAVGTARVLAETTTLFKVRSVVPISGAAADRDLMPILPGLSDAGSCRDWDSGIPLDLGKVRKKDEEYWDEYRGTPKAFVSLAVAQNLWSNRFGNLTAVRYSGETVDRVSDRIRQALDPATFGFVFRPVREDGLNSAAQSVDFGQLFLGLSGFIMIAALILMGLLFVFGVEQRAPETGTLLALGFTPRQVRRLFLAEGACLALLGAILGAAGGLLYNRGILHALGTVWTGAVGVLPLEPHVTAGSLAGGTLAGVFVALLTMGIVLRKQAGRRIVELQSAGAISDERQAVRRFRLSLGIALVCLFGALAIAVAAGPGRGKDAAGAFFGAGALMLLGALAACNAGLWRLQGTGDSKRLGIAAIGWRNSTRRRGRSLATIGLLACGIFLVFAVGANRQGADRDATRRESGTGGFALVGETAIPIVQDLNNERDRRKLGLNGPEMEGVRFVQIRVRDGDDASCLNLNRAQNVRILGVRPQDLAERRAFSFTKMEEGRHSDNLWAALNDGVSAAADQTVIVWGLGKKPGAEQSYADEAGRPVTVKLALALAPSIFQGSLLISEARFNADFPSTAGYRMFLVDVPRGQEEAVAKTLRRALEDYGVELTSAAQRLAEFMTVENTYLAIFMALGGLGLILGSVGLGLVVLRNVQERRRELAMLRAVGYSRGTLQRMILAEHLFLLGAGVVSGLVSAIVAILPALMAPDADLPVVFLAGVLLVLTASGALWTWLATAFATRGDPLPALRDE